MSEGCQVSKVTMCPNSKVAVSHSLTHLKGRYRAARAAKKWHCIKYLSYMSQMQGRNEKATKAKEVKRKQDKNHSKQINKGTPTARLHTSLMLEVLVVSSDRSS